MDFRCGFFRYFWLLVVISGTIPTAWAQECRDLMDSYSCHHWRSSGMCDDAGYRELLTQRCQKTCGFCERLGHTEEKCRDERDKCLTWKNKGYCEPSSRYSEFMKRNCKRVCYFCEDEKCTDKRKHCPRYKKLGYCDEKHEYHLFMKKRCSLSCGFCVATENKKKKKKKKKKAKKLHQKPEFVCDFEIDECDWSNEKFDDTSDWLIGVEKFGPRTGFNNTDNYLYLSSTYEGYHANLWLPWQLILPDGVTNRGQMCFNFWYQMTGGKITVSLQPNPTERAKYPSPITKFTTSRKARQWTLAQVSMPVSDKYTLYFKGVRGKEKTFVAVDNMFFTKGRC